MVQGQVFLKGGVALLLLIFFQYLSVLHLNLHLHLHFTFFCYEKSHSKLSKNERVCVFKKGWCVRLG